MSGPPSGIEKFLTALAVAEVVDPFSFYLSSISSSFLYLQNHFREWLTNLDNSRALHFEVNLDNLLIGLSKYFTELLVNIS